MSQFVKEYYNAHAESEQKRLDLPLGKIEFASTLQLIDRYFPRQGHICDIGGGTGRYTIELLRRGYLVTLFDLSEEEIKLAGILLDNHELTVEQVIIGDARDMSMLASNTFDAALLLGPMYHVVKPDERAMEAKFILLILNGLTLASILFVLGSGLTLAFGLRQKFLGI